MMDDDAYREHVRSLRDALRSAPAHLYTHRDTSPERNAARQAIVDDAWSELGGDDIPKGRQGLILGGLPGSGKTQVRNSAEVPGVGPVASHFLPIDPDYFKGKLIDAGLAPSLPGFAPMETAPLMHKESNDLAKALARKAYGEGTNIAWDYSLRHPHSPDSRMAEFDHYGYTPHGIYVHADPAVALARTKKRHRDDLEAYLAGQHPHGGRYVPPEIIGDSVHGDRIANRDNYDRLARHLATSQVFDTTGGSQRTARNSKARERSLDELAQAGYITDGWREWQQGGCIEYAHALKQRYPHLQVGVISTPGDVDDWQHIFVHDGTYAYDSAGRHPLPYTGVHSDLEQHLEHDLDWYDDPDPDLIDLAYQHIDKHKIGPHTAHRTAMPAPMPEGITFHHYGEDDKLPKWMRKLDIDLETPAVEARHNGKPVGYLAWDYDRYPAPTMIYTHPDYRRQGIGTALWDFARQHEPDLEHSEHLTDLGEFWVNHEQSRQARRTAEFSSQPLNVRDNYTMADFFQWCAHNHKQPTTDNLAEFAAVSGMDTESYLDNYLFLSREAGLVRTAANKEQLYTLGQIAQMLTPGPNYRNLAKTMRAHLLNNDIPNPSYTSSTNAMLFTSDDLDRWDQWDRYRREHGGSGKKPLPPGWAQQFRTDDPITYIHNINDVARELAVPYNTASAWFRPNTQNWITSRPPEATHFVTGMYGSNVNLWSDLDPVMQWYKQWKADNPAGKTTPKQIDQLSEEFGGVAPVGPGLQLPNRKEPDGMPVVKSPPKAQDTTCPKCFTQHAGECL